MSELVTCCLLLLLSAPSSVVTAVDTSLSTGVSSWLDASPVELDEDEVVDVDVSPFTVVSLVSSLL